MKRTRFLALVLLVLGIGLWRLVTLKLTLVDEWTLLAHEAR